ncbi:MAG: L,D-transpeptidase [Actinobacteria bacterium]|nr:L,D-transpeptidase [Actinomycetota bacterium]
MQTRTRDIVILIAGLAVLASVVLGGYAAVRARAEGTGATQVLAPVPRITPAPSGTAEPQYERWTVGVARRPLTVYRRADASSPVITKLPMQTSADYPMVVLVDSVKTVGDRVWYRVWVPIRPNETRGWIREGHIALYSTTSKIVIDLSERTLSVYRRGVLAKQFPVAVGKPGLATPTGSYYITQKLRPADPNGVYGVLQLGTSAFQPKLNDWPDGGQVGIHGTNEPWLIGKAVSHGCVRMKNKDVKVVSRLVPTGSPVEIVK